MLSCLLLSYFAAAEECNTDGSDALMKIEVSGDVRTFKYNGCPMYDWSSQSTPNKAEKNTMTKETPAKVALCKNPIKIDKGATVDKPMGMLAIALDGVPIYTPWDAEDQKSGGPKGRDAVIYEGISLGHCGGHPTGMGGFHYHAHPGVDPAANGGCEVACSDPSNLYTCSRDGKTCTTPINENNAPCSDITNGTGGWYSTTMQGSAAFGGSATAGTHSPLIGFAIDGIPIYGLFISTGGEPSNLDECNGHSNDMGFYHYHATRAFPYIIGCFKGVPDSSWSSAYDSACDSGGVESTADYSQVLPSWQFGNGTTNGAVGYGFLSFVAMVVFLI